MPRAFGRFCRACGRRFRDAGSAAVLHRENHLAGPAWAAAGKRRWMRAPVRRASFMEILVLRILKDPDAEDPRGWDNLGTMACWHRRYRLGDRHSFGSVEDMWKHLDERGGRSRAVVLPLYLYDHSGLAMSAEPYWDPWDSGQVGYIFADAERIRREYRVRRISAAVRREVEEVLRGEVEVYNWWLRGEVYGYQLFRLGPGGPELEDSCWGFYGSEAAAEGIAEHLPQQLASLLRECGRVHDGQVFVVGPRGSWVLDSAEELAEVDEPALRRAVRTGRIYAEMLG